MNKGFDSQAFQRVWQSLAPDMKQAIKDKAQWEHMTLSAVMRDYWPDLWKQVEP